MYIFGITSDFRAFLNKITIMALKYIVDDTIDNPIHVDDSNANLGINKAWNSEDGSFESHSGNIPDSEIDSSQNSDSTIIPDTSTQTQNQNSFSPLLLSSIFAAVHNANNPELTNAFNKLLVQYGYGISVPWQPNQNLTPSENMDSLGSWLMSFLSMGSVLGNDMSLLNGQSYLNFLRSLGQSVKNLISAWDLDSDDTEAAQLNLIEKVANVAQSYYDSIFQQVLSYQSWYLQQEYNSPANQLKRLSEAGLNSSFIFGSGYSNTASSPAGTASVGSATSLMSGAGEVAQQERSSRRQAKFGLLGAIAQGAEATASLINAGINSIKTLAEAENVRLMTPLQVSTSLRSIKNLGVTYDRLRAEVGLFETENFSKIFDITRQAYQQDVQNAQQGVQIARSNLDAATVFGTKEIEVEKYVGSVTNQNGERVQSSYTLDELNNAYQNGGKDKSGNIVFSTDDMRLYAEQHPQGSVNLGVGKVGNEAKFGMDYRHGSSDSQSSDSETNYSVQTGNVHTEQGFNGDTQTLFVGNSMWKRIVERQRVDKDEYVDVMNAHRQALKDATDRYTELTTGERARTWANYDMFLRNYARGQAWSQSAKFRHYIESLSLPQVMVGD